MTSSRLRRRIGAGVIAFGAMAGVLAAASPSGAQQPPEILTVVGSDTTDQMMSQIVNGTTQINIRAQQTTPVTVPGDANCSQAFTYRAVPQAGEVASPNGSSAGRNALREAVNGANGNFPAPGGFGRGCVDIARSSSEPRPVNATNDLSSFEYYAFALDAMAWASPSLQAPGSITLQQARDIWTCTITRWEQLPGGGTGQIQRVRPQSSSGTFQSFTNNLLAGVTIAPASATCPAPIDVQENTGKDPAFNNLSNPQLREQAFMAYSLANWSFQANASANPTLDVRNGVRPLGWAYASNDVRYGVVVSSGLRFVLNAAHVNTTNPNFNNQADHTQMPGVRRVYNVIDSTSPSYVAARDLVGFDIAGTAKSPLCSGQRSSIIRDQGFQPIAAHNEGANTGVTCIRRTPS